MLWNGNHLAGESIVSKEFQDQLGLLINGQSYQLASAVRTYEPGWAWAGARTPFPQGEWTHVGMTYDGDDLRCTSQREPDPLATN